MTRGGSRKGAGRPKGSSPYKEARKLIRVPVSRLPEIQDFVANGSMKIPLYSSTVQAGYPSLADEHVERQVDLNSFLVKNPGKSFMVKVTGDSMIESGIHDGDTLIVDHSIKPVHGKMVVAAVDGQVTVKYLHVRDGQAFLVPANKKFKEIPINPETGTVILGVVTSAIKML